MTTPESSRKSRDRSRAATAEAGPRQPIQLGKPRKQTILHKLGDTIAGVRTAPLTDYGGILFIVMVLTITGVVMAMSASLSWSIVEAEGVWQQSTRQAILVIFGLAVMWFAVRIPLNVIRKYSFLLLMATGFLLLLVFTPLGVGLESKGSQSWLALAPGVSIQPSEIARIAIAIWGAKKLSEVTETLAHRNQKYAQFIVVALAFAALIFLQRDVGMGVSFLLVAIMLWFFAGGPKKSFIYIGVVALLGFMYLLFGGGFRSDRFTVYFDALRGDFEDTKGAAFQSYQGYLSLADGGVSGLGLGQSRAKWFYLPEAKNDFIFAVLGEEMGLIGAGLVIILFAILGFLGLRVARRVQDGFVSMLAATLTAAIVAQAFINMGYVVGLFPVTGIQLPLLSSGGTSAVITLGALGLLINCARHEPEAMSQMANFGRPTVDQILMWPEPKPEDVEADDRFIPLRHNLPFIGGNAGMNQPATARSRRPERPVTQPRRTDVRSHQGAPRPERRHVREVRTPQPRRSSDQTGRHSHSARREASTMRGRRSTPAQHRDNRNNRRER